MRCLKEHAWIMMGFLLLLGISMYCLILPYSPLRWGDEVMINELYRGGIGNKVSDWSMMLFAEGTANHHAWAPYWIGGWWLEMGWQLFGALGPRIMTLISLLLALLLFCIWSYTITKDKVFTVIVGILFFAHPALNFSAHGGRVESVVFFFLFATLLVLEISRIQLWMRFIIVGVLTSLMLFTWATSIVLLPIVAWGGLERFRKDGIRFQQRVCYVSLLVLTMGFAILFLLIPFFVGADFDLGVTIRSLQGNLTNNNSWSMMDKLQNFLLAFFVLPVVYPIGWGLLFCSRRTWFLAVFMTATCILFCCSFVHICRMIYVLPYAMMGIVIAYDATKKCKWGNYTIRFIVICMALFSYVRSIGVKGVTEFWAKGYRDYNKVTAVMEKELGRDISIYEDVYELYYVGRDLGWRQFMEARIMQPDDKKKIAVEIALDRADYYLCSGDTPSRSVVELLKRKGFRFYKKIDPRPMEKPSWKIDFLRHNNRLSPLGPYCVWTKKM